jgi:dTDP-4-amino-4,6-dideoxygalactose transaminase
MATYAAANLSTPANESGYPTAAEASKKRAMEGGEVSAVKKTMITKNIKAPDPVPQAGIDQAVKLMETGKMYRYSYMQATESPVSVCEVEITQYTGHKYCVALNSCGSALYLMLLAAGCQPGDKVLTNAFTFVAVPSAIHHAHGKPVYVESTPGYVLCTEDLEVKAKESGAKFLMISHMRGKIADMDEVKRICDKYNVILLEDCAHSIGVRFGDGTKNARHTGHHGVAACISSQSYKMLNSGEGGFYLTDNDVMAAKVAVYAGAYEQLSERHITVPPLEVFGDLPNQIPNYSLRMSCLTAAVIRPQIKTLEERVEKYNKRYYMIAERLNRHPNIQVPPQNEKVRICGDSIQFNLKDVTDEQVTMFLKECKSRNLASELFGHPGNARNFVNWKFSLPDQPLPKTAAMIKRAIDIRLPLTWEDADFVLLCQAVEESMEAAMSGTPDQAIGA